ncbi:hypothetical protein [Saccharothrix variisporea]|uniref:hypothetical protein n=1 Tax=Saccharothrix variisporea TaxID=543527 RepID=UPI0011C34395|nr:hypothetical protein [Saccharothrix variisporea]
MDDAALAAEASMQDQWALLGEALKSGYGTSVLLLVSAWITKPVWLAIVHALTEWVRSLPARRRMALEEKVVDQALSSQTKEQGDRAYEVLQLLLRASAPELSEQPVTDPPESADTSSGDPTLAEGGDRRVT